VPPRSVTGIALFSPFPACYHSAVYNLSGKSSGYICIHIYIHTYKHPYIHTYIRRQGIYKRMVRFQKLLNIFLILHWHNIHCQRREYSTFLMRFQQITSHAYCMAAGLVSKMASQQEKAVSVLRFELSISVITVQRVFRIRFKKGAPHRIMPFFKPCTKLTLRCNHRSGHL
jgi:hypothetical protein